MCAPVLTRPHTKGWERLAHLVRQLTHRFAEYGKFGRYNREWFVETRDCGCGKFAREWFVEAWGWQAWPRGRG